ncbi:hypothetical protein EV182_001914 [Spiromyces aspiralis]|uniref:Uncharacterized protein n=1 Tax=Spiromyces aspiralis TaxID=68401 RepID=A0ACC1HFJ0_9FUNG|nr:hypothetical protein EV182_001914 [Spiromyces aspiralis]
MLASKVHRLTDDLELLLYILICFVAKDCSVFKSAPVWREDLQAGESALKKVAAFIDIDHVYKWADLDNINLLNQHDWACLDLLKTLAQCLLLGQDRAASMLGNMLSDEEDLCTTYGLEHRLDCQAQLAKPSESRMALAGCQGQSLNMPGCMV